MNNALNSNIRLYFASSLFSVISILQIQVVERKKAYLVLENEIPNVVFLREKIKDLKLFSEVIILNVKNKSSLKYYLRKKAPSGTSLLNALFQSLENIYLWLLRKFLYWRYVHYFFPKELLDGINNLYMSSASFPCIALADYLIEKKQISNINLVEEGMRDYCTDSYIRKVRKLMIVKDVPFNLFINLPKLSVLQKDKELLNLSIFQINKKSVSLLENLAKFFAENKSFNENEFIYFDQMILDVTRYQSWGFWKKKLLKNSLKKAQNEINLYPSRLNLIQKLIKLTSNYNLRFKVRLHPRCESYNNFKGIQKDIFYSKIEDKTNIPWEFILLASKNKKCNLLSLYSTSVVSSLLLYGNSFSGKIIFLYKLTQENIPNLWIFETLQKEFPDKIFIPTDWNELEKIII